MASVSMRRAGGLVRHGAPSPFYRPATPVTLRGTRHNSGTAEAEGRSGEKARSKVFKTKVLKMRQAGAKEGGAPGIKGQHVLSKGKKDEASKEDVISPLRRRPLSEYKYPTLDDFPRRHIGPDEESIKKMLAALDPPAKCMDDFIDQVIPPNVINRRPLQLDYTGNDAVTSPPGMGEAEVLSRAKSAANQNMHTFKSLKGTGYYGTMVPEVIKRNVLESPAWYTSYTPYQAEISQGRLECLLNFQTMVSDLTALPIANASLLDEGTAAAEAMTLSLNALPSDRAKRPGKTFVVSDSVHPQTIGVLRGRAAGFGIEIKVMDLSGDHLSAVEALGEDLMGVMVQYPDTYGRLSDFRPLVEQVHKQGALLSCATDLLALTIMAPPGEWGADVAFGSAQRFGVPMGYGGPHAAFFAVQDKYKRKIPGRLVGVSQDRRGQRALRLALQTREQHIRREKATSNVCTAQALLANMSSLYAVYHGPRGLRDIALRCKQGAMMVRALARHYGLGVDDQELFDTVMIECGDRVRFQRLNQKATKYGLMFREFFDDSNRVGISVDEEVTYRQLHQIAMTFAESRPGHKEGVPDDPDSPDKVTRETVERLASQEADANPAAHLRRKTEYLTHPVFNTHHSETELLRYIHHLQSKDLSLVHSMIPLGSCTMKLNSSTEMATLGEPGFANLHPHTPVRYARGYFWLRNALARQLADITGMHWVSLQPNSGAQGEFAGLRAIRDYHEKRGEAKRDICLIPVSAHGTNPASAAMAGMRVVPVKCDTKTGNLDMADLEAKCARHADELGAIMVTYPSTFGVFEPEIRRVCETVHAHGGQVYMDGANMNAQIGLCSPGDIGADVCHLNLHKTFCIPHGGGGPGVGPICVKDHLASALPSRSTLGTRGKRGEPYAVASGPLGSASILPISWAYNVLMGGPGLRRATEVTLLNANYLLGRLRPHYPILYTNEHGRCAHEFILDARPFAASAGIEAIDIAKRLQDYGFHAPTMSWPVANTLMIEPTESESQEEMDRFVDALVSIRAEIADIERGDAPRQGNVLKMAPHPMEDIIDGDGRGKWERPYSREKAAYPLPWLREKKFWPTVARIDDKYGDLNLFCTCPPVEDTTGGNLSSVQQK